MTHKKYKILTLEEKAKLLTPESIYRDVQELTERVYRHRNYTAGFDRFALECADVRRRLIQGYSGMSTTERQDLSLLLDNATKYIQERLDVMRGREMSDLLAG